MLIKHKGTETKIVVPALAVPGLTEPIVIQRHSQNNGIQIEFSNGNNMSFVKTSTTSSSVVAITLTTSFTVTDVLVVVVSHFWLLNFKLL